MNGRFRTTALPVILLASTVLFAGCATQGKPPPVISLDEPVQAQPLPEPPKPIEVVAVPEPLALPAQLKPLPDVDAAPVAPEPADEKVRVSRANAEARIAPTREGYVNAIQVWPFTDGALYQVYASVSVASVGSSSCCANSSVCSLKRWWPSTAASSRRSTIATATSPVPSCDVGWRRSNPASTAT